MFIVSASKCPLRGLPSRLASSMIAIPRLRRVSTFAARLALLVLAIGVPHRARAEATPAEKATAQALFDDARRLASAGQFAQACPKFEESLRLDRGIGTQFHLANCYEQAGRTASAWTTFIEVASAAKEAKQPERERVARERVAALEPKLSRLTVIVAARAPDGLVVKRDGLVVGKAQWGTALPIDPGAHTITAVAPAKKAWQKSIDVPGSGGAVTATVPELADEAEPPSRAPEPAPAHSSDRPRGEGQRRLGLVVAGIGVVGLTTSGVLGLLAKAKYNTADDCDDRGCGSRSVEIRDSAFARGNVATIVFAIGAAATVGGAGLWLTAPSAQPAGVAGRAPWEVGIGPEAVTLRGRW
jgi:hypothetical protein